MDGLTIFIEPGAPGVVPQAAPVGLLLEADHFWDLGPFLPGRLKCPQLRQAGRTCTNHRNSCHVLSSPPVHGPAWERTP